MKFFLSIKANGINGQSTKSFNFSFDFGIQENRFHCTPSWKNFENGHSVKADSIALLGRSSELSVSAERFCCTDS